MKYLLYIAILFALIRVEAQQSPVFTQFMYQRQLLNPAITGSEGYLEAQLASHRQWVGFEGGPVVNLFSVHSSVLDKKFGVGGAIMNDRFGPFVENSITGSYAHHFDLKDDMRLGIGFAGHFSQVSLDLSKAILIDEDPALYNSLESFNGFTSDVSLGAYVQNRMFYAGASVTDLVESPYDKFKYEQQSQLFSKKKTLDIILGKKFYVNENIDVKTGIHGGFKDGFSNRWRVHGRLDYLDVAELGLMLDLDESFGFFGKVKTIDNLYVTYSYEMSTDQVLQKTPTHEFSFIYHLFYNDIKKGMKPLYNLKLHKFSKKKRKMKEGESPKAQPRY